MVNKLSKLHWFKDAIAIEDRDPEGHYLKRPIQVEMHPYFIKQEKPCTNNCLWCTRGNDRQNLKRGIDPQRLIDFIYSLNEFGVPGEFALAGNCTEPLLYPRIKEVINTIKEINSSVRLYSNFLYGNKIYGIVPELDERDIIRISLDAGKSESYIKNHRPCEANTFSIIIENIKNLIKIRSESNCKFSVIITYLLNKNNCDKSEIEWIMRFAATNKIDAVWFSRPLKPFNVKQDFKSLTDTELTEIKKNIDQFHCQLVKSRYNTKFHFDMASYKQNNKSFLKCHCWKIKAILSSEGVFFPCSSTAISNYTDIGYGDINADDFDFSLFWNNLKKFTKWHNIEISKCPECTRVDYLLNEFIDKQVTKHNCIKFLN